jgi:hypothetical protein
VTAFDIGDEVRRLILRRAESGRFSRTRSDEEIPSGGDEDPRFQFNDHEVTVSGDGSDDPDLL